MGPDGIGWIKIQKRKTLFIENRVCDGNMPKTIFISQYQGKCLIQ